MDAALKFCPRCAGALEWRALQYPDVRHPVCAACGYVLWQNPKPSVEALIVRGMREQTEVLLGRRAADPASGLWDIPGGFLNADDRMTDALVRECRREMGIDVRVGELLGAFEDTFLGASIISLVFLCEIAAGEPSARDIIDEVGWFSLLDPPPLAFPAVEQSLATLKARPGRTAD